jgi:hypothetical protein
MYEYMYICTYIYIYIVHRPGRAQLVLIASGRATLCCSSVNCSSIMSDASACKRQRLANLGRRRYISQNALAELLKELQDLDEPLGLGLSRSSIKRARKEEIHHHTAVGPLFRKMTIGVDEFDYMHPVAMMHHMLTIHEFKSLIQERLRAMPSTPDSPWRIVIYSDEVSPGNNLKHENKRKFQTIYWSFAELGPRALSSEFCWFPMTCARSSRVKALTGGMSEFMARMSEPFVTDPCNFAQAGVLVHNDILFGSMGIMVSDADALKQSLDVKGASGTLICPKCRNITDTKSEAHLHDRTGYNLPLSTVDTSRFDQHTDESIRESVRYICAQHATENKTTFKQTQQYLGINYNPAGMLFSTKLIGIIRPVSMIMYDWMHVYLVTGIWNHELAWLLQACRDDGHSVGRLGDFCNAFSWPGDHSARGATGKHVFDKPQEGKHIKCSASEALGAYQVVAAFLKERVQPTASVELLKCLNSYYQLVEVLNVLRNISRGGDKTADELHNVIGAHMQAFSYAYTEDAFFPKCHYALHLSEMLRSHGILIACWTHERKHKEMKRFANPMSNMHELSVLEDVAHLQFRAMEDPLTYPADGVRLINAKPAPALLTRTLQDIMETKGRVMTANAAMCLRARVFRNDVVLAKLDGGVVVAKVLYHAEVDNMILSCISPWTHMSGNMYNIKSDTCLIDSKDILEPVIYRAMQDVAYVV